MRTRSIALAATALLVVVSGCAADDGSQSTLEPPSTTGTLSTTTPPPGDTTAAPTTAPGDSTTTTTPHATTTSAPASVTVDPFLPQAFGRAEVPWGEVGAGWYVVLFDASKADAVDSSEVRDGPVVLYLVDPTGTRYEVASWPAEDRPWQLLDVRGTKAIVSGPGATFDDIEWHLVDMQTGVTTLVHEASFPETTASFGAAVGLTRPTGANLVVYRTDGSEEWLDRTSPSGSVLATLYRQPYDNADTSLRWLYGYEGTTVVVAHHAGMALVSNSGDAIRQLWVPPDTRCEPVRWWGQVTFLAVCYGQGPASAPLDSDGNLHVYYGRLWLLETDGAAGVPLTQLPEDPPIVVDFGFQDAWPTEDDDIYLQWSGDCGAAAVALLHHDGTGDFLPIEVPPSLVTDGVQMVDIVDRQLAIYGWQGCGSDVGSLFVTDLSGSFMRELVPVVGDARSVIGVRGYAAVYP